jgi:hypothetical protein
MYPVALCIANVVKNVNNARKSAVNCKPEHRFYNSMRIMQMMRKNETRKQQQVLYPLLRAKLLHNRPRQPEGTRLGYSHSGIIAGIVIWTRFQGIGSTGIFIADFNLTLSMVVLWIELGMCIFFQARRN